MRLALLVMMLLAPAATLAQIPGVAQLQLEKKFATQIFDATAYKTLNENRDLRSRLKCAIDYHETSDRAQRMKLKCAIDYQGAIKTETINLRKGTLDKLRAQLPLDQEIDEWVLWDLCDAFLSNGDAIPEKCPCGRGVSRTNKPKGQK